MTDEVHDLATIEGCITWTLLDKAKRAPVMSELRQLRAMEAALERLARVGGEFSYHMAGPHWEELCEALRQARAALRG